MALINLDKALEYAEDKEHIDHILKIKEEVLTLSKERVMKEQTEAEIQFISKRVKKVEKENNTQQTCAEQIEYVMKIKEKTKELETEEK